jgi:hypothetical protein
VEAGGRTHVLFSTKTSQTELFYSPISRGTSAIIPLQLVLSRKIFKKVTKRIFPMRTAQIPACLLEKLDLFTREGNVEALKKLTRLRFATPRQKR